MFDAVFRLRPSLFQLQFHLLTQAWGQFSELSTGLVLGSPASRFSLRQGIPLVRSVASLSTRTDFVPFLLAHWSVPFSGLPIH
jgi:hypothetical protein